MPDENAMKLTTAELDNLVSEEVRRLCASGAMDRVRRALEARLKPREELRERQTAARASEYLEARATRTDVIPKAVVLFAETQAAVLGAELEQGLHDDIARISAEGDGQWLSELFNAEIEKLDAARKPENAAKPQKKERNECNKGTQRNEPEKESTGSVSSKADVLESVSRSSEQTARVGCVTAKATDSGVGLMQKMPLPLGTKVGEAKATGTRDAVTSASDTAAVLPPGSQGIVEKDSLGSSVEHKGDGLKADEPKGSKRSNAGEGSGKGAKRDGNLKTRVVTGATESKNRGNPPMRTIRIEKVDREGLAQTKVKAIEKGRTSGASDSKEADAPSTPRSTREHSPSMERRGAVSDVGVVEGSKPSSKAHSKKSSADAAITEAIPTSRLPKSMSKEVVSDDKRSHSGIDFAVDHGANGGVAKVEEPEAVTAKSWESVKIQKEDDSGFQPSNAIEKPPHVRSMECVESATANDDHNQLVPPESTRMGMNAVQADAEQDARSKLTSSGKGSSQDLASNVGRGEASGPDANYSPADASEPEKDATKAESVASGQGARDQDESRTIEATGATRPGYHSHRSCSSQRQSPTARRASMLRDAVKVSGKVSPIIREMELEKLVLSGGVSGNATDPCVKESDFVKAKTEGNKDVDVENKQGVVIGSRAADSKGSLNISAPDCKADSTTGDMRRRTSKGMTSVVGASPSRRCESGHSDGEHTDTPASGLLVDTPELSKGLSLSRGRVAKKTCSSSRSAGDVPRERKFPESVTQGVPQQGLVAKDDKEFQDIAPNIGAPRSPSLSSLKLAKSSSGASRARSQVRIQKSDASVVEFAEVDRKKTPKKKERRPDDLPLSPEQREEGSEIDCHEENEVEVKAKKPKKKRKLTQKGKKERKKIRGEKKKTWQGLDSQPAMAPVAQEKGSKELGQKSKKRAGIRLLEEDAHNFVVPKDFAVQQEILTCLRKLMEQDYAYPFLKPVDPDWEGCETYLAEIENPMDLGTICRRLEKSTAERSFYHSGSEIMRDIALIWSNCRQYNGELDPTSCAATQCVTYLDILLEKTNTPSVDSSRVRRRGSIRGTRAHSKHTLGDGTSSTRRKISHKDSNSLSKKPAEASNTANDGRLLGKNLVIFATVEDHVKNWYKATVSEYDPATCSYTLRWTALGITDTRATFGRVNVMGKPPKYSIFRVSGK